MEKNNNINIAEILKDCPKGMKLYSSTYGEVKLSRINNDGNFPIIVETVMGDSRSFTKEGRLHLNHLDVECFLFPSSKMHDWTKFFKRGDILVDGDIIVLFEEWVDSSYRCFKTSLVIWSSINKVYSNESTYNVKYFQRASKAQQEYFIKKIEAFYNGKYNPITLQVEPVKPKCPFKPFDKVLVRDEEENVWYANYFSHYKENDEEYPYVCIDSSYRYCIPYENNEHLLGTTDPYKEGGSK